MLRLYRQKLEKGYWRQDREQENIVRILDYLSTQLTHHPSFWERLRNYFSPKAVPLSVYISGPVGRGKTALMDLFYQSLSTVSGKKRMHFHAFMQDIHQRIFLMRQHTQQDGHALVAQVARDFCRGYKVFCFDEFHVDNIVDSSILHTILSAFFEMGLHLVTTSNSAPDDLYPEGLHRSRFLPCIELIKQNMVTIAIQGQEDYRLRQDAKEDNERGQYYTGPSARESMDQRFKELSGVARGELQKIWVRGRELILDNMHNGVARFSFEDLCGQALGAVDYLALMPRCRAIFIDDVPLLNDKIRDKIVRFITLIDVIYEARVYLVMSSALRPLDLCQSRKDQDVFQRTSSRLMQLKDMS